MWEVMPTLLAEARALPNSYKPYDWAGRLSRAACGFRSASASGITVHFNSRTWDNLDIDLFLMCCQHARNDLNGRFGFSVDRVRAFLFDDQKTIAALCNRQHYFGLALSGADWVLISRSEFLEEIVLHELVHLFAARWNNTVPFLLSEGLAVWLTRSHFGRSIHDTAREYSRFLGPLSKILDNKQFVDSPHALGHYYLAGSFTGYLLRHYSWERYRQLYRRAKHESFERDFQRVMGLSMQDAETGWRSELRFDNLVKIIR
jgi:hypothetical protein